MGTYPESYFTKFTSIRRLMELLTTDPPLRMETEFLVRFDTPLGIQHVRAYISL